MATTQELLIEARAAYHALNTGSMARVIVDQDGQRTEFVAANAAKLYAYIQSLEGQMPGQIPVLNGPVGFLF